MPLNMPAGKRLAIVLSPDLDAHSVWMGTFRSKSQGHLSRGEFCARVGTPRLLDLFDRYGITTTWFVPTHTMQTFGPQVRRVIDAGHEIAAHGVYHEFVPKLDPDEERRLIQLQVELHEKIVGVRPRGYRSPALDLTDHTLDILHDNGFEWESSLMGHDFEPYHPSTVTSIDREHGNSFSAPSPMLEFPVSWALDDFPELESFPGNLMIQSTQTVLSRWIDSFDYAYERCPGGIMTWTLHPQTIGRSQNLVMLERFLDHVLQHPGIWFPTLSEAFDAGLIDAASVVA